MKTLNDATNMRNYLLLKMKKQPLKQMKQKRETDDNSNCRRRTYRS